MSPNAVPVYPNSQTFNRTVIVIGILLASAAVGALAQVAPADPGHYWLVAHGKGAVLLNAVDTADVVRDGDFS